MILELGEKELEALSESFFALSSVRRLRILYFVTEPRSRQDIADELGISRQAVTQHLNKLIEQGFVEEIEGWRESGPVAEFRVIPNRLFALGMTLVDLGNLEAEGGEDRLASEPTQPLEAGAQAEPVSKTARQDPHLLILDGPEAGERFQLRGERSRWTIGRGDDRDLELGHDPYVSSQHCEIRLTPRGYAVVDAYSANGTQVNFGRLPKGERAPLEAGDVVRVGRTNLVFQKT